MSQIELASFQISRRALPWMLAAFVASLVPHLSHLPYWLTGVSLLCILWRWGVHRGRISYPSRRLQFLFALLLAAGVFLQYRTLAGHVAGTAMLLAMYSLKLLEMYKERDGYVVILIGYFFAATAFLFHFDLLTACYVLFVVLLFTATLVAINTSLDVPRSEPLKRAGVLLLQSIPLAIILFVVIPRIGPLWGSGLRPSSAQTGVSDEMAPGSVGELALSDELAFRVDFDGRPPPPSRLYWRGLTLSQFDGRTWRQSRLLYFSTQDADSPLWFADDEQQPQWLVDLATAARAQPTVQYTVYLEPTQRPWLFALSVPVAADSNEIGFLRDYRVRARTPVKVLMRYRLASAPGLMRDAELPEWVRAESLELPAGSNPQAREWALQQRAEAGSDNEYVRRVLAMFGNGSYAYTLKPPALGAQPVDEFLFGTRRGFCEHYAGSFTFLMRAAGIPARVVAGYQGGELNPLDNTVQVRQYDAHAWAEIWLPGSGWTEIDPTAYVSPARIERGPEDALGAERAEINGKSLAQTLLGNSFNTLRDAVAFINHRWNTWVLGFDDRQQQGLLTRWLGEFSAYRIGLFVAGSGATVVLVLALWMFAGNLFVRRDPVTREYLRFCAAWAARGHARREDEGPYDYGERLRAVDPQRAVEVTRFIALYVQLAYGGQSPTPVALRRLRAARVTAA